MDTVQHVVKVQFIPYQAVTFHNNAEAAHFIAVIMPIAMCGHKNRKA